MSIELITGFLIYLDILLYEFTIIITLAKLHVFISSLLLLLFLLFTKNVLFKQNFEIETRHFISFHTITKVILHA